MVYRTVTPKVGERFGRLIVTGSSFRERADGRRRTVFTVKCDCGNTLEVWPANLRTGNTTSCGCFHRERAAAANTTHGGKKNNARLYRIWKGMHERCQNPQARNYRWYGGKGISVCAPWSRFESFRDWALSHGYADGLEIDRIDAEKNYSPNNCRWLTKAENVRRARNGLSATVSDRLVRFVQQQQTSVQQVIEEALDSFLPE